MKGNRKNIYIAKETENLLSDLAKDLQRSQSEVIQIALNFYNENVKSRAMQEFDKCHDQLDKSIMYLQAWRDYGQGEGCINPAPWTEQDDEILELLFKAYTPIMYFNNNKIRASHPDWFDEDGDLIPDKL